MQVRAVTQGYALHGYWLHYVLRTVPVKAVENTIKYYTLYIGF